MNAWRAVGWFWLVAGLGIMAFLLTGTEPLTSRERSAMTAVSAPTPRGRCWLAPSRVRRVGPPMGVVVDGGVQVLSDESKLTMLACTREPRGCLFDNVGVAWALEEPIVVECVADGHGRRTR